MDDTPTGFVIVDKEPDMTSHDVVARMRRIARTRKVGHGGTLDPMATGVLVLAVGRITRLLTYVSGSDKSYEGTIQLGRTTVTDDAEGEVTSVTDAGSVTDTQITDALATMVGDIAQVPSAVSAIKIKGQRAYKRVAAGEDVELPPRQVTISKLDVVDIRRGAGVIDIDIAVECSSGTYIRAIARDLGEHLSVGGHLTALRRTSVAGFGIDEAQTLSSLAEKETPITHSTLDTVRRLLPCRSVTAEDARKLGHGGKISAAGFDGPYAIIGPDETVVAIVSEKAGSARPEVVLAPR